MDRRNAAITIAAVLLASVLLSASAGAQVPNIETSYTNFTDWLPVVGAGIMLSIVLVGGWYMLAAAVNNSRAKAHAINEMTQVVATAFLVVLIIGFITFWNSVALPVTLAQKATFQGMCTSPYLTGSQLNWVNSQYVSPASQGGWPSPTNIVCTQVLGAATGGNGNGQVTGNIDYGLGVAYILAANMTNQTVANLNSLYYFEGTIGWLRSFTAITTFCIPDECAIPLFGERILSISYQYTPFPAYVFERSILPPVEISATMVFYLFFLQMVGILMMIYMWPYLLAAGIILRVFFFTRRIGGLLIALVLVSIIIYPMITIFEYDTLSPGVCSNVNNAANCLDPIGSTSIPNMAICELPLNYNYAQLVAGTGTPCELPYNPTQVGCDTNACMSLTTYQLNFYSLPRIDEVMNYYGCYPPNGNLVEEEAAYAGRYLIPFFGLATGGIGLLTGLLSATTSVPTTIPEAAIAGGYHCFEPTTIAKATFMVINAYGAIAITGFILPLLNVLLSLSALLGISSLLGGDTFILGISRFI